MTLASVDKIRKRFGDEAILLVGESPRTAVPVIPSGCISVDLMLGVGGWPRGRITEIYGPEKSGKTTLCLHAIAEAQALGLNAAIIDMEHDLDLQWAQACGVDVSLLYLSQPDTAEQALETVEFLLEDFGIIVIDSVAALVPRAELEGEYGQSHMGLQARLMGQAMRKLRGLISNSNAVVIFTNQLRYKIGVMFGSPETTTGGVALRFYASVRIDIRQKSPPIKIGGEIVGNPVKVTAKKNKVGAPYKEAMFDIMYDIGGISKEGDILDLAVAAEIVEKRGSFFYLGELKLGQGRENVKAYLRENPVVFNSLENEVRKLNRLPLWEYDNGVQAE